MTYPGDMELRRIKYKGGRYEIVAYDGEAHVAEWHESRSYDEPPSAELLGSVGDLMRNYDKLEAKVKRIDELFSGGPDTACRTVWRDGIECVSVPIADLRRALDDPDA